ncbi:MAG TPA: hypothetical protein VIC30_04445 [Orrella sp.]
MSDSGPYNPTLGKGGIFQWSAGAKFTTMLGGDYKSTLGAKNEVMLGVANSFAAGTSNAFKLTYDVGLTFGKSYAYKAASDVSFAKSKIEIQEYGGSRCLDLFQASAGLGPIQRAAFQAQRQAQVIPISVMIAVDIVAAAGTLAISGFGSGFKSQTSASPAGIASITGTLVAISGVTALVSILIVEYLDSQRGLTKPETWQPNATIQASSHNGIFIGYQQSIPEEIYSSFKQNGQGSVLRVSRGGLPIYGFSNIPGLALDADLNEKHIEYLGQVDDLPAPEETYLNMTEQEVSIAARMVNLTGNTTPLTPLPDSSMDATFQDIKLVATELSAEGPGAQLQLEGSSQMASLVAQEAPGVGSSVKATPELLLLKSGETSMVQLGAAEVSVTSAAVTVSAEASVEMAAPEVSITGDATVSITGALVRIG